MRDDQKECLHCRKLYTLDTRFGCGTRRGLCHRCHSNKDIRNRYPRNDNRVNSDDDFNGGYAYPPTPTDAPPGSEEKIAIMRQRVEMRVRTDHYLDAQDNEHLSRRKPITAIIINKEAV